MDNFYTRTLSISGEINKEAVVKELQGCLTETKRFQYAELWIEFDKFPSLCALVNGERAWLMYIRYDGDAGFSSRNPKYQGAKDAVVNYLLSNGQMDDYPTAWSYATHEVFEALEYFAANRKVPSSIAWHNDSGDGNSSPNEFTKFEVWEYEYGGRYALCPAGANGDQSQIDRDGGRCVLVIMADSWEEAKQRQVDFISQLRQSLMEN